MTDSGRKTTHYAWNVFALVDGAPGQARCLLCNSVLSGSSDFISPTNLVNHLKSHKKVSDAFYQNNVLAGSRAASSLVVGAANGGASAPRRQSHLALPLPSLFSSSVSSEDITAMLLDVIACDKRPFSFFDSPSARALFRRLVPGYTVPHPTTFSRKLPALYAQHLELEKAEWSEHGLRGSSITFDYWTDSTTHYPYLTVCATRSEKLNAVAVVGGMLVTRCVGLEHCPQQHTGEKTAKRVAASLQELGLDNTVAGALFACTTDTASNMVNSAVEHLRVIFVPCFPHLFSLLLKSAFESDSEEFLLLRSLLLRVRGVTEKVHRSRVVAAAFARHVSDKQADITAAVKLFDPDRKADKMLPSKLKTYAATRFSCVVSMFRRLLILWSPIMQLMVDQTLETHITSEIRLTPSDKTLVQAVHALMSLVEMPMMSLQSATHPTLSRALMSVLFLHRQLNVPLLTAVGSAELPLLTSLRTHYRLELRDRFLVTTCTFQKLQTPSSLVTATATTAGVPSPSCVLNSAFSLAFAAVILDPWFASDWRVWFNDEYSYLLPEPPHDSMADKRGDSYAQRLLLNLCFFEVSLYSAPSATPSSSTPAASATPTSSTPAASASSSSSFASASTSASASSSGAAQAASISSTTVAYDFEEEVEVISQGGGGSSVDRMWQLFRDKSRKRAATPASVVAASDKGDRTVLSPLSGSYREEVNRWLHYDIPARYRNHTDPLLFWSHHASEFPILSRVAARIFSASATSCEPERVFSAAGRVVTPERSSLAPEKLKQLVFLARNIPARLQDEQRRQSFLAM
jgi:hypothetical protein